MLKNIHKLKFNKTLFILIAIYKTLTYLNHRTKLFKNYYLLKKNICIESILNIKNGIIYWRAVQAFLPAQTDDQSYKYNFNLNGYNFAIAFLQYLIL